MGAASWQVAGALLLSIWAVHSAEVVELSNTQHKSAPSAEQTAFDEGADINNPESLFPGPTYGLPGYKESHNWVTDFDLFSPVVFDEKWYALEYGLAGKSEAEIKKDWSDHLSDDQKNYPADCRQGNEQFSPQKFYRANPEIKENLETSSNGKEVCGSIVKEYIKSGMFDASSRYNLKLENAAAKEDQAQINSEKISLPVFKVASFKKTTAWAIGKDFLPFDQFAFNSVQQYTLSFWYQSWAGREPECNVLHHGNSISEKAPMISQVAGGSQTLKFVVSQSNDNNFGCTANRQLVEKEWTYIVLKVHERKIEAFYDGKSVCSRENSGGKVLLFPDRQLYVSSPFQPPADGVIQQLQYYPNWIVKDELLALDMEHQRKRLVTVK
eukprot:TRINITY_DN477_c0_g1_i1.p1 TRINITY_DN477_c0_g1~~TRINITY_DN477_c0_g1_i1.p1  ORF type:complete len:383 (-),score=100.03 TRINITY_DN477_c0_g1_i1:255-1403(-)